MAPQRRVRAACEPPELATGVAGILVGVGGAFTQASHQPHRPGRGEHDERGPALWGARVARRRRQLSEELAD